MAHVFAKFLLCTTNQRCTSTPPKFAVSITPIYTYNHVNHNFIALGEAGVCW